VRASHDALVELFERIGKFVKPLGDYAQISLTKEMVEVFLKITAEVLSILSIATREVRRWRASESFPSYILVPSVLILDQKYISVAYPEGLILRTLSIS
jgi:hypothetical protein